MVNFIQFKRLPDKSNSNNFDEETDTSKFCHVLIFPFILTSEISNCFLFFSFSFFNEYQTALVLMHSNE